MRSLRLLVLVFMVGPTWAGPPDPRVAARLGRQADPLPLGLDEANRPAWRAGDLVYWDLGRGVLR